MKSSDAINEIATSLAKAQGEYESATKDQNNPHFNRRYADLASGLNACRDALSRNGIAVVQSPSVNLELEPPVITVETKLMHGSGQWISGELSMPVERNHAQGVGSAITYARRYALFALVGIAPEDDDGNAATGSGNAPAPKPANKPAPKKEAPRDPPMDGEQKEALRVLCQELNVRGPDIDKLCNEVTGVGPAALTRPLAKKLIEHMQEKVLASKAKHYVPDHPGREDSEADDPAQDHG